MHEIDADRVLLAVAGRHPSESTADLLGSLRDVWHGVAGDLAPDEAVAVLWAIQPAAFILGGAGHSAARARVARALYPERSPAAAVAAFRRVLARGCVRAAIDALRAEETLHVLGERHRVRAAAWSLVSSEPPPDAEAKDINAHNANRLRALHLLVALDGLAAPPPAQPDTAPQVDGRKSLLDRFKALR